MAGTTIYDVAAAAGVSIKSVSRVLNGEANVSETLRDKVNRAVEDVRINNIDACPGYSSFPIINPGEENTLWCESTGEYVTFDSGEEGYIALGSGMKTGYKKPRRVVFVDALPRNSLGKVVKRELRIRIEAAPCPRPDR